MKKLILTAISLVLTATHLMAADTEALTQEARGVTMQFGKSLKQELVGAMKSGGPIKALGVCNTLAPELASEAGSTSGWDVGRTTLKLRNQSNAPDDWELTVLKDFEQRKAAGEDITKMETTEVVEMNGQRMFRYMKAIPTGKPCMACHAAEVAPQVEAKLKELYPDDVARGFKPGDIRGAFTLMKTL